MQATPILGASEAKDDPNLRKNKSLLAICKKFLELYPLDLPPGTNTDIPLEVLAEKLNLSRRRLYDIINVMESLQMAVKVTKKLYRWYGLRNVKKLMDQLKQLSDQNRLQELDNLDPGYLSSNLPITPCETESPSEKLLQNLLEAKTVKESPEPKRPRIWKNKSLGGTCLKFLTLFFKKETISLEWAGWVLLCGEDEDNADSKSDGDADATKQLCNKIRRIYDVVNVLTAVGLVCKLPPKECTRRRPFYRYCGPVIDSLHSGKKVYVPSAEPTGAGRRVRNTFAGLEPKSGICSNCKRKLVLFSENDKGGDDAPATKRAMMARSSVDIRLMAKNKEGGGLGRYEKGITAPIALKTQPSRQGLGFKVAGLESQSVVWDWRSEVVEVKETLKWLPGTNVTTDLSWNWIQLGEDGRTIADEHKYCSPEILKKVLGAKSVFDQLDDAELRKARGRCNPFESIGKVFFQNRAALKMANIDAACDMMFTNPKNKEGQKIVPANELLYFADICAGPGGFSEYVLWRKRWQAKGFGFTLRGEHDFKLEDFNAASAETFEPCYGKDGDGNIYKPINIRHFQNHVLANTDGKGVHFTMADGGFSVDGQEDIQEVLSHRLYLCQCLVALSITRPGGHFVVKLFDVFTPFSAGLIWLMRRAFHKICIFRPNTSQPANSERYLVCKHRLKDVSAVRYLMWTANEEFEKLAPGSGRAVVTIVPEDVIAGDKELVEYLTMSNNELGQRQVDSLNKIKAFCQDSTLFEPKQAEMRKSCLDLWCIPKESGTVPKFERPEAAFAALKWNYHKHSWNLTPKILQDHMKILEWRCYAMNSGPTSRNCTLFLTVGRGNVYYLDGKGRWLNVSVQNAKLDLPAPTLVFGELVSELRGESDAQSSIKVLHVMDAHVLGGRVIGHLSFDERVHYCKLFAKAIERPSRNDLTRFKVKQAFAMDKLDSLFAKLKSKKIKQFGGDRRMCIMLDDNEDKFHVVGGLSFMKVVKEPWTVAFSKTASRKYWFNQDNGTSLFKRPPESNLSFRRSVNRRLDWWWHDRVSLATNNDDTTIVHRVNLIDKIEREKVNLRII
ncbi:cap-specific mRNA (nucleoside-2'-O-)-methyltransferase 1-like [Cloeon dipterum]|uniref:cap-specific mRNA (nucleoside-2'-O-)-methyltransferase 1-like n=1 Tax=Cloeon dipterum TaxID=197152 RepID=UPI003220729C